MSIATKTGDAGETSLCTGAVSATSDPRVDTYGCVDELNSALGVARVTATDPFSPPTILLAIQKELINGMGELATRAGGLDRYAKVDITHNKRDGRPAEWNHRRTGKGQAPALPGLGDSRQHSDLRRARFSPKQRAAAPSAAWRFV